MWKFVFARKYDIFLSKYFKSFYQFNAAAQVPNERDSNRGTNSSDYYIVTILLWR